MQEKLIIRQRFNEAALARFDGHRAEDRPNLCSETTLIIRKIGCHRHNGAMHLRVFHSVASAIRPNFILDQNRGNRGFLFAGGGGLWWFIVAVRIGCS